MSWVIVLFTAFMPYRLFESLRYNGTDVPWLVIFGVWFVGFVVLSLICSSPTPAVARLGDPTVDRRVISMAREVESATAAT